MIAFIVGVAVGSVATVAILGFLAVVVEDHESPQPTPHREENNYRDYD